MSNSLTRRIRWMGLALAVALGTSVSADAAEVLRRSTETRSLSGEDRARLAELGLRNPTSAVVVVRRIPKSAHAGELARLRSIAATPVLLAPSNACDVVSPRGDAHAFCSGHVDGPLGQVPARMPISAAYAEGGNGGALLVIRNSGPLEVKPFLSWSDVVAPDHLLIAYQLEPEGEGWRVTTRVGVEMLAHADSAKQITDTLLRVESWLSRDLPTR